MSNTILFARIAPSELSIITTENNNIIDLGLCCQIRDPATGDDIWSGHGNKHVSRNNILSWGSFVESFYGGGNGDFGLSQVAGRMATQVGAQYLQKLVYLVNMPMVFLRQVLLSHI